jgi:hypothetical protein
VDRMQEYFGRTDTPAASSPVGSLVVRIMNKNPGMDFEEARSQANALQQKAAGKWKYQMPRVWSEAEQAKRREDMRNAFRPLAKAA